MRRPGSMAVAVSRALYEEGMTRRAVAAASPEPTPNTDATKMSAVTGRRSVVHSGARSGRHPDRGPWVLTREHPGTSARVRSAHRGAEREERVMAREAAMGRGLLASVARVPEAGRWPTEELTPWATRSRHRDFGLSE